MSFSRTGPRSSIESVHRTQFYYIDILTEVSNYIDPRVKKQRHIRLYVKPSGEKRAWILDRQEETPATGV
jgi:hypothetical protein